MKLVLNGCVGVADKLNVTTWTHELGGVRALRDAVMKIVEEKMSKEIAAYIKEREAEAKLEVDEKSKADKTEVV